MRPKKETDADSISKAELREALKEAHEQIQHMGNLIAEYKWLEGALRRRTFELSERVKELDCWRCIYFPLQHMIKINPFFPRKNNCLTS